LIIITRCSSSFALLTGTFASTLLRPLNTALVVVNMHRDSLNIPLKIYHGVPKGWSKDEILKAHKSLGGAFSIDGEIVTEPGAPAYLPDRYNWLQYRATLYRVNEGVKANDIACIELSIRYIELNYIGSYSGFIREKLARALKNATLTESQTGRLKEHFQNLINRHECFQEFREYKKLFDKLGINKAGN